MRASTASSGHDSRGDRTLMGIGPEFIRRERAPEKVSGTFDGVPTERMDRTPSSPIVVEPQARRPVPARTVRVPIAPTARTVQLSVAPAATAETPVEEAASAPGRSRRLDSLISGRFFQEGELQEANGWEDSPLAIDPPPDEAPPAFSSFDRIPRKRGPLIVTTFILGTALLIGFAVKGVGVETARAWMATEAGQRVADVLNRAKSGLAIGLTPESTVASARAMAAPAASAPAMAPAGASAPQPERTVAAAAVMPVVATQRTLIQAPFEAKSRRPSALALRTVPAVAHPAKTSVVAAPAVQLDQLKEVPVAPAVLATEGVAVAAPTEPRAIDTPERRVAEPARRGLVWSPSEQRLIPAQASAASPPADSGKPPAKSAADSDKTVLPLDDDAHTTF